MLQTAPLDLFSTPNTHIHKHTLIGNNNKTPSPEAIVRAAKGIRALDFGNLTRNTGGSVKGDGGGIEKVGGAVVATGGGDMLGKKSARRPTVTFSPHNRHHPYDPELRLSLSKKTNTTPSSSAKVFSLSATPGILTPAPTPLREVVSNCNSHQSQLEATPTPSSASQSQSLSVSTSSSPLSQSQSSPAPRQPNSASNPLTLSTPKSILKRKPNLLIRVVNSVEEGTRGNAAEFRRGGVVGSASLGTSSGGDSVWEGMDVDGGIDGAGKRPGLVARDSFTLGLNGVLGKGKMVIRAENGMAGGGNGAGGDGIAGPSRTCGKETVTSATAPNTGSGKCELAKKNDKDGGNSSPPPPPPTTSIELVDLPAVPSSSIESLLNIITYDSNDLLSVEDAYNALFFRLRKMFSAPSPTSGAESSSGSNSLEERKGEEIKDAARLFQEKREELFKAFKRDVERLIGLPPNLTPFVAPPSPPSTPLGPEETSSSSPTRQATNHGQGSPTKPKRQGYSEVEVSHRRAAAGVGQSALKVLAFVFNRTELFGAFDEDQNIAMLRSILVIPSTPKLFTPNSKKTYPLAVYVLAHIRLPISCLSPLEDELLHAVTYAVGEGGSLMWGGGPARREGEGGNVKARQEGFAAIANLCALYPSLFLRHHKDLIPPAMKAMTNGVQLVRNRAVMVIGAITRGKLLWRKETQDRVRQLMDRLGDEEELEATREEAGKEWLEAISIGKASEWTAYSCLKGSRKSLTPGGNRITELMAISEKLKATFLTDQLWACTAWSNLVSILGDWYLKSEEDFSVFKVLNQLLHDELQRCDKQGTGRFALARLSWNHAIHAVINNRSVSKLVNGRPTTQYPLSILTQTSRMDLCLSVMHEGLRSGVDSQAEVVARQDEKGTEIFFWSRKDTSAAQDYIRKSCLAGRSALLAYTQAIRETQNASVASGEEDLTSRQFEAILNNGFRKLLTFMFDVCGMDDLKVQGWRMLAAMIRPLDDINTVALQPGHILQESFLSGDLLSLDSFTGNKATFLQHVSQGLEKQESTAIYIPSWAATRCLPQGMFDIFGQALLGIRGISELDVCGEWVMDCEGHRVLPTVLDGVWRDLLEDLKAVQGSQPGEFHEGYREAVLVLADFYEKCDLIPPVMRHLPASAYCPSAYKSRLVGYLLDRMIEVLDIEALKQVRLAINTIDVDRDDVAAQPEFFGADRDGKPTLAGALLWRVTTEGPGDLSGAEFGDQAYIRLLEKLVDLGCAGPGAPRFLGDLTNALPAIAQQSATIERGIWTILAKAWATVIKSTPASAKPLTVAGRNRTGALLLELLRWPFTSDSDSWASASSAEFDIDSWRGLLEAAVQRCIEKGHDPSISVIAEVGDTLTKSLATGRQELRLNALDCLEAFLTFPHSVPLASGLSSVTPSIAMLQTFGSVLSSTFGEDAVWAAKLSSVLHSILLSPLMEQPLEALPHLQPGINEYLAQSQASSDGTRSLLIKRLASAMDFSLWPESSTADEIRFVCTLLACIPSDHHQPELFPFVEALDRLPPNHLDALKLPQSTYELLKLTKSLNIPALATGGTTSKLDDAEPKAGPLLSAAQSSSDAVSSARILAHATPSGERSASVQASTPPIGVPPRTMDIDLPSSQHPGDIAFLAEEHEPSLAQNDLSLKEEKPIIPAKTGRPKRPRSSNLQSGSKKRRRLSREASQSSELDEPAEEDIQDCIIVQSPPLPVQRALTKSASTGMLAAMNRWLPQLPALPFWSPSKEDFPRDIQVNADAGPSRQDDTSPAGTDCSGGDEEDNRSIASNVTGTSAKVRVEVEIPAQTPVKRKVATRNSLQVTRSESALNKGKSGRRNPPRLTVKTTGPIDVAMEEEADVDVAVDDSLKAPVLLDLLRQADTQPDAMESMSAADLREVYAILSRLRERHHEAIASRL